jgi:hypothetical protein
LPLQVGVGNVPQEPVRGDEHIGGRVGGYDRLGGRGLGAGPNADRNGHEKDDRESRFVLFHG